VANSSIINADESNIKRSSEKSTINTTFVRTRYAFNLLNEINDIIENIKKVIMNEEYLFNYTEDMILLKKLQSIVSLNESADSILIKLNELLKPIEKYDSKLAMIINEYISNRKDVGDVLRFIYSNIFSIEDMRRLYLNIDIILGKINELNDKSLEPIKQRLILLKKVFDKIRIQEQNLNNVAQQENFILVLIRNVEKGIKDGSWKGFIGPKGLATQTDIYINIFINEYGNDVFADMLKRNKRKYGESQPEKWLGEEMMWQEYPDSLWYMYKNLRATITAQINQLWSNAFRIGQSLKSVIEQVFGKNPSSTLEEVKKRLIIFERNIRKEWKTKREKFKALYISANLEAEKVLNFIEQIENKDESIKKNFSLRKSYVENKDYEAKAEKSTSALLQYGPYIHLLSRLALTSKLFENNKILQEEIAQSLETPPQIDENLISNLKRAMKSTLEYYMKLFDYIKYLRLNIRTKEIEDKIYNYQGGLNG